MPAVYVLVINIVIAAAIAGFNVLVRRLTQEQQKKPREMPGIDHAQAKPPALEREPEQYFEEAAKSPEKPVFRETGAGVASSVPRAKAKPRMGAAQFRQAVIMAEIIREPRAKRPWPSR